MKKVGFIVLFAVFGLVLIGCNKKTAKEAETTTEAAPKVVAEAAPEATPERIIVGMATDVAGLGDGSFNDGVYAGLKRAEDEGLIDIRLIEPNSMTDYVPNLSGLAEDGAQLIFAVGFLFYDALLEVAPNYPDTMFAGIDLFYDPASVPANILGINWKENESGYLAGVVAGMMTKEFSGQSDKLNDQNIIGAVLGMDIPPVERYFVGFAEGARSVNPDVDVRSVTTGTFGDQAKGKEATIALAEQGADIVIHFAGLTGMGIFTAAREKNIFVMGADIDQNSAAPEYTLTSAMKGTTQAAYLTVKSFVDGTFQGGTNSVFGLKEEAVDIASFHDFESIIPPEVKEAIETTKKGIVSGDIVISKTRAEANM